APDFSKRGLSGSISSLVSTWNQALYSPPCMTARRGGCVIKKFREATEADADGVVFLFVSIGKPPRPRDQRMLRDILLIARPPLVAVMQGGEWPVRNIRTFFTSSN